MICALKQTNSRSLTAAKEYISKMSYPDLGRDQMGAAAARTTNTAIKAAGGCRSHVYCGANSQYTIRYFINYEPNWPIGADLVNTDVNIFLTNSSLLRL